MTTKSSNDLRYSKSRTRGNTRVTARIRLNDECQNGHQDFSITCDIHEKRPNGRFIHTGGGANHETILKYFPEFKIFIDLHLSDYNGVPIHAIANGFYHLTHDLGGNPEEYCKYYRITPKQYDVIKLSENKIEYGILLNRLGILKNWKKEAIKATKLLEELTDTKFINDSKGSHLINPTEDQIKDFETKKQAGYYEPHKKEERRKQAYKKAIKDREKELMDKASSERNKINQKLFIDLFILKHFGPHYENYIYYDHNNLINFNWLDYKDKITEDQFNKFCEGLTGTDLQLFNRKLNGPLCFNLNGVKFLESFEANRPVYGKTKK